MIVNKMYLKLVNQHQELKIRLKLIKTIQAFITIKIY